MMIAIYFFSGYVLLSNSDTIINKLYTFFFIFMLQFVVIVIGSLLRKNKLIIVDIVDICVKNGLLSIIAYDTFNDLKIAKYFDNYNMYQKTLILTVMIMAFIITIQILQILMSN